MNCRWGQGVKKQCVRSKKREALEAPAQSVKKTMKRPCESLIVVIESNSEIISQIIIVFSVFTCPHFSLFNWLSAVEFLHFTWQVDYKRLHLTRLLMNERRSTSFALQKVRFTDLLTKVQDIFNNIKCFGEKKDCQFICLQRAIKECSWGCRYVCKCAFVQLCVMSCVLLYLIQGLLGTVMRGEHGHCAPLCESMTACEGQGITDMSC